MMEEIREYAGYTVNDIVEYSVTNVSTHTNGLTLKEIKEGMINRESKTYKNLGYITRFLADKDSQITSFRIEILRADSPWDNIGEFKSNYCEDNTEYVLTETTQ